MITEKDLVFHLQTASYSYLFRINAYGQPEHLHFGLPVDTDDADAFQCHPGLGWGGSVLLKEGDSGSCADDKMLEWSGSGRGDYRESPLELAGISSDLRYASHEILTGSVQMASTLPQAKGGNQTLHLILEQPGLRLHLYYTLFPTALTRRAVLENTSDTAISFNKLMSFSLDLPGSYTMTSFHGGWIAEMHRKDTPVTGSRVVNEALSGSSSHRNNPGFLLSAPNASEDTGTVYGFNLIYSGNHYSSAQRNLQGFTRVMQGISPSNFLWELAPNASFEAPEAVLCWSNGGFNGLSHNMHQFVVNHIIPPYWHDRMRPIVFNSWEGCMFDFTQSRLLDLADRAKDLGCELFVLDDGWFGARNDDHAGLGDYTINTKKLPQGLTGLAQKIQEKGLQFGLWFEPESVNPDSDLYRAHPDWALTDSFPDVLERNQLLLDLTRTDVQDYLVENVTRILDSAAISYVKWDMNRHSIALGAKAHRFLLGLYSVYHRIFDSRPDILLENCASGGNRFDLGMLTFGPQIWCSDDTDPIERLDIQTGLSYLYPQSTFGTHVSAAPHAQTLRHTPLSTRGNVSFFGCLGYELDLKHLLPVESKEVKAQIAFYKQYRKVFQYGAFTRTKLGWQVSLEGVTLAGVFHKQVNAAPGYEWLKVTGLQRSQKYQITSLEQAIRIGQFSSLLKHVAPIPVDPNGVLVRLADSHFTMPSGAQSITASGAALESGVPLLPLFRGTGYDKNQRTYGDYGSDLYIITPLFTEST